MKQIREVEEDGNVRMPHWSRVIIGNCPRCGSVVLVVNTGGVWPLVKCSNCDWAGDTHDPLNKARFETVVIPSPS